MRTRVLIGTLFVLALCVLALATPALAVNVPSCGGEFVLFAQRAIRLEQGPTVIQGDILVNGPNGFIEVGAHNVITGTATAHRLVLGSFAQIGTCRADVFEGADENVVCGSVQPAPPLPCLANYPPIPAPPADPCVETAQDVTVPAGQTVALPAGCYGDVRVNPGGTLNLSGSYNMRSVLVRAGSTVNGPATLNVKNTFFTETSVTINTLNVNIGKATAATLLSIGRNSTVINSDLNAPFARVRLHIGTGLSGSEAIGNVIVVEPIETVPTLPGVGIKRGVKFNDQDGDGFRDPGEPGLADWIIRVFNPVTHALIQQTTTNGSGEYVFNLLPGQYLVCEVLQPGWVQTFPGALGPLPNGDSIASCAFDSALGPLGYLITLDGGEVDDGNDFGNNQPQPQFCPEDTDAVCTVIIGNGGFSKVQAAFNAASDGATLCMFTNTTENVVLNGTKSLTITQCTTARVTAADNSLPAWTVSGTGKLTVIGADSQGGSVGWLIDGHGHDVRGVRSSGASQIGIKVTGSNNSVSFNSVAGSPVGVRINGSGNDVRGGTVYNNGTGVRLGPNATNNRFRGATVRDNGVGILVEGPGNTIDGNRVGGNSGHGIHVTATATSTKLKSNQSGDPENGGAEYQLDVSAVDLGGNRADGVGVPGTKCGSFPQLGTCE